MWTIFKVFIEFVTILLLFYVLFFLAMRHVGFLAPLAPRQGIEPTSPALESKVLTTEPPVVNYTSKSGILKNNYFQS